MLATAGPLPVGPDWGHEAKWDGMRGMLYVAGDRWRLLTRVGRDVSAGFPEFTRVPDRLAGRAVVVDGELVAVGASGVPEFGRLQRRMSTRWPSAALLAAVPVQLYLFDVLHLDGRGLLDLPYARRRELLEDLGLDADPVRTPPTFPDAGAELLTAVQATGLEGVVSKRLDSRYTPGRRSRSWVKTLVPHTTRAVIVGWLPGQGRRAGMIGALVLGAYDGRRLRYLGRVGTGFTTMQLRELGALLHPLTRSAAAVRAVPDDVARRAVWVEPTLVGVVAYRSYEADGLRHPSWHGLVDGVNAGSVRMPTGPLCDGDGPAAVG